MTNSLATRDDAPTARDIEIYHIYIKSGRTQRDIAGDYGLSQARIGQICKTVEAFLRDACIEDLRNIKVRHKFQLEDLYFMCMEGWQRSASIKETVTEKTVELVEKENGVTIRVPAMETTIKKEPQAGDPRFLQLAKDLLKEMRELFGEQAEGDGQRVAGMSRVEAVRRRIASQKSTLQKLEEQVKQDETHDRGGLQEDRQTDRAGQHESGPSRRKGSQPDPERDHEPRTTGTETGTTENNEQSIADCRTPEPDRTEQDRGRDSAT